MKPEVLDTLGGVRDFHSLTKAVLDLCEPYGPVHELRMVHNRRAARVFCFVELESPRQQTAMVRALGARSVNDAACFEIPVSLPGRP
jgi:RNA recognition motif-containing protein